ncbi:WD40/YVTN/BNR-like repeat-containing protein, partial [Patescibacteria group bacterium]
MKQISSKKIYIFITSILSLVVLSGCGLGSSGPAADGGFFVSYNSAETWEAKNLVSQTEAGAVTISTLDSAEIIFDPQDPLIMYFISRNNGIYRSIDGGEKWSLTTLSNGSYSALAVDPVNSDIIYAAQGVTILKSVDGMGTWATIYVETRPKQTLTSLTVDSFDPSIIYASTQSFVIKSEDFGTTWRSLDWTGTFATKLFMSKQDTRTLYLHSLNYGLYKTVDGGETWTDLSEGLLDYRGSNIISAESNVE